MVRPLDTLFCFFVSNNRNYQSPVGSKKKKSSDTQKILKLKLWEKQTSENVRDAVVFCFLWAKMIAETASLELVAKGIAINETKKEGILVALEKFSTASIRGSAKAAAMTVPSSKSDTDWNQTRGTFSTTSSLLAISISYSPPAICKCLLNAIT